jgi:antitoxin HicB
MNFIYSATLEPDPDGGFLVTFVDVPEAITHGATREEALANASEALGLALRGYAAGGQGLPQPAAQAGLPVYVDADDALKLAVIDAFRTAGITKTELARRMGKSENEARRILDPDHPTKLGTLQAALRAMNRQVAITLVDAA